MSLSDIDIIFFAALREWTPLTELLSAHRIQVPEREIDLRGRECFDLKGIIKAEPMGWNVNSGGAPDDQIREDHNYEIIIESAGMKLATARAFEHAVRGALMQLVNQKSATGLPLVYPPPYTAIRWYPMTSVTQEARPADNPNRWVTRMNVRVSIDYSAAGL